MSEIPCEALLYVGCRPHGIPPQARVLVLERPDDVSRAAELRDWLRRYVPSSRSRLMQVSPHGYAVPSWVGAVVGSHMQRLATGRSTIAKFGAAWARNVVRTLRRQPRWATTAREPWAGRPVLVVGAGVDLDRNGHLLAEAQRRGPVVALNSSAGCCAHYGVTPDVIVCCEVNGFPEHVRPFIDNGRTLIVLDALASTDTWAAASGAAGIFLHEPYFAPYLIQLGVMPLHYSTSSSTAATSLALLWGASEIVLVGHSHACDGEAYAMGSPFRGNVATVADGLVTYEGGGKEPYTISAVLRQGWNGGDPVWSDHTFSPVIEWYAAVAERETIINTTEGGSDIPGTYCEPLASVIERYPIVESVWVAGMEAPDTSAVLAGIERQARDVVESGATEWPVDFPLLGMWVVPVMEQATIAKRRAAVAEAVQRGAREILETLREAT